MFSPPIQHWISVVHASIEKISWVGTAIGMVTGLGGAYEFFAKRLRNKDSEIGQLKAEQQGLRKAYDDLHKELKENHVQHEETRKFLPSEVLVKAGVELQDNNYELGHAAVSDWLRAQSVPISRLLILRSKWVISRSGGQMSLEAFVAARAYAQAAVTFAPDYEEAQQILSETSGMLQRSDHLLPSVLESLTNFEERTTAIYRRQGDIGAAEIAEYEALRCHADMRLHTALALEEWVVALRLRNEGEKHCHTLQSQYVMARMLADLRRDEEALGIAQSVANAQSAHPEFGPNHPDTLLSRELVAKTLRNTGKYEEALGVAHEVMEAQAASKTLGPDHPYTLNNHQLVARILDDLGRREEALGVAQDAVKMYTASHSFGSDHPSTLMCRQLVAAILRNLGREKEALGIAEEAMRVYMASHSFGPDHPSTLMCRQLVADILNDLGPNEEALTISQEVAQAHAASSSFGPDHLYTLHSRRLVARILHNLGRHEEALELAQKVVKAQAVHRSLGPDHPDTVWSRSLVSSILLSLGRNE